MNHNDKCKAIRHILPNARFELSGDELTWFDDRDEPTEAEIAAGWIAYQAVQQSEAEAVATAKAALLQRLGITEAEAKLLLS